jgi:uncharacterized protein (UPF0332 family)
MLQATSSTGTHLVKVLVEPGALSRARFPAQCRARRDRTLTISPLARDLRLKAERALATARELQDRDPDGSVNRSYYAMFDIARAALLSAGVREDELPRTHSGLIGLFSKHAVLSGRIDQKLFGALGRAESLRLIADYTGTPLDAKTAADTVSRAEHS